MLEWIYVGEIIGLVVSIGNTGNGKSKVIESQEWQTECSPFYASNSHDHWQVLKQAQVLL